jgi:hypothetical protein
MPGRAKGTDAVAAQRVILGGDEREMVYLARIAELEAEVQALAAELARFRALAVAGTNARLTKDPPPRGRGAGRQRGPLIHVTADGTQGMRRGVSGRRSSSSQDDKEQP